MANEQQMKAWLNEHGPDGGRVIIFKDGCPFKAGQYNSKVHVETPYGWKPLEMTAGYNIYVGPQGEWENKGDGGWVNWAFQGGKRVGDEKVIF
ncbi:unnamed protein product [Rotaria socialis]|uniref:Uncharacterized protein n=2 Tax=Rotaria socialis TaxID=392032 RepID=A0A818T8V4_9BILA|nr:unnamed protein product [Rotaria socialis]CAF3389729.1 unnamed protein product [Rotaria socialis]CAF3584397.1 unnamed protein product [Rotaria socialis]CAF3674018.1 unnamed protein product [Rotaria socialis]CAF4329976.1 unnamed protein product [Rotaria socialis]